MQQPAMWHILMMENKYCDYVRHLNVSGKENLYLLVASHMQSHTVLQQFLPHQQVQLLSYRSTQEKNKNNCIRNYTCTTSNVTLLKNGVNSPLVPRVEFPAQQPVNYKQSINFSHNSTTSVRMKVVGCLSLINNRNIQIRECVQDYM